MQRDRGRKRKNKCGESKDFLPSNSDHLQASFISGQGSSHQQLLKIDRHCFGGRGNQLRPGGTIMQVEARESRNNCLRVA